MDYNDNDFQSHNLDLADEESPKFSPVLRPYVLPKFEFDDTLQEDLRFDSLVETEVFLGIGSNTDNQWIEDFSRGNSGIEFGSNAAESCSTARRNNVWSKATSSESVEMLLKSVGQEEIVPVQSTFKESDVSDEPDVLAKQMEPSLKHDDNISSRIEDATNVQPSLLEDEIPGNFSKLKDDAGEERPRVEGSSQTFECETSIGRTLSDQDPNAVSASCGFPLTKGSMSTDGKCENMNKSNNSSSIDEFQGNTMSEHASTTEMQVDNVITSMHDIIETCGDLRNRELGYVINDASDQKLQAVNGEVRGLGPNKTEGESGICNLDDPSFLAKKVEFAEERNNGNSSISDVEQHSCMIMKKGSELPILEGCSNAECSEELMEGNKYENTILYGDKEVGNQSDVTVQNISQVASADDGIEDQVKVTGLETSSVTCKNDEKFEERANEFSSSDAATCASLLEPKIDSLLHAHGHSNFHVGGDSSTSHEASFSAELQQETPESETLKCTSGTTGVCTEPVHAKHHGSSSMLVESVQVFEEEIMPMTDDVRNSDKDVSDHGLEDKKEFISHSLVGKEVELFSSGVVGTDNNLAALNIHSDVTLENTHKADSMKIDSAPVFSSENLFTFDGNQNLAERSLPVSGFTHLDKKDDEKEETANKRFTETGEICLDSELGKKQLLSETGELSNAKTQDELQTVVNNENAQECSKELEAHPLFIASTEKEGDATVTVLEQSQDATVKEKNEKAILKDSGESASKHTDSDEPTCGSPTVIRAVQPSQNEKKEVVKGSEKDDVPVTEIIEDARKTQPICQDSKGNDASKSDTSFTFEVNSLANLSGKEFCKSTQSPSTISSAKETMIVDGSPSAPEFSQTKPKVTRGSPKDSDVKIACGSVKGTALRKPRRASPKGSGKETPKKGSLAKERTPRKSEKRGKVSIVSVSSSGTDQLVPSKTVQLLTTTATLPDLNSLAPPSVFQQPFTDLQQVQLRAQIFVYGSLIQGVAPDEPYMISAFGGTDGGRSTWESAWQTTLERSQSQKSPSVNPETPLPPHSDAKASDQQVRQTVIQSNGISTPAGRTSSKVTPSIIVNPMIPISSPLWNISTPCDTLQSIVMPRGPVMDYQAKFSPLHPYQTPPVRNFVAHNTWVSQPPFHGPWVAFAPPSTVDTSARFPLLPSMEPVQLTHVKEQSDTHSSGVIHLSPGPMDLKKVAVSSGTHSADPKTRKRKKASNSENSTQTVLPSQSQPEPLSTSAVTHVSGSFTITTPVGLVPKPITDTVVMNVSPVSSIDHLKIGERDPVPGANFLSEDNFTKVKEIKLHAEEAAALAASAVNYSQTIWSQLDKQKSSGSVSDIEAKLASAAVAVAAAASVAKAAAAAAKVAHDAALQAKFMADEAFSSGGYGNPNHSNEFSLLATSTHISILKADEGTNSSSSIIIAAKEAARRRVEAASAASRGAENLDAIVKAAELAAEAVSQTGKIICMGDPLSLKELVERGPAGYWMVPQVSSDVIVKAKNVIGEQLNIDNVGEDINVSTIYSEGPLADEATIPREISTESKVTKSRRPKGHKVSDMSKTSGVIPESEIGSLSTSVNVHDIGGKGYQSSRDTVIKEGSQVEIFKNDERFKAAWYPANILSLKNGKAYVGYKELISDEGPVKEWVTLEGEGNDPPIIRLARPITAVQFEGTRKRRRTAMGDYCWSVGNRVDALIHDSWREGVVTEKNKKDETSLTINFPAQNESLVVQAWHLRPSLIWKDGEWIEWSSSLTKDSTGPEGDTPQEKRMKITTAEISKGDNAKPGKPEEPKLVSLSANDIVFNIGKNSRDEKRPSALRKARTGLQKERSGVVFGVPKPGKKRKFMEVTSQKDSTEVSNYLMPRGSRSRGWRRDNLKTDPKETQVSESKPKTVKSGRSQSASSRTLQKNDPASATLAASGNDTASDNISQINRVLDASGNHKTTEFGSSNAEATKGKLAPSVAQGRLPKTDKDKVPKIAETRRSVRQIHPTSRLLEGLQSSLTVSKTPSISQNRSHNAKNASKGK